MEPKILSDKNPRGEETRQSLIRAGVKLFSLRGLEATSTRDLSSEAGVNLAAIAYHFGSKEGLYREVARHVALYNADRFLPLLQGLEKRLPGLAGDRHGLALEVKNLYGKLLRAALSGKGSRLMSSFILRELNHPGPGYDLINQEYLEPATQSLSKLAAVAFGRQEDEGAQLSAYAFMGMSIIFQILTPAIRTHLGWQGFSPAELEKLEIHTAPMVLRAFGLPEV